MYIGVFSRSEGAGRATTRKTRGLTRSVMARMVPPLPAPSRPSKTMMTRRPLYFTQSWSLHNSAWSWRSFFSYFFVFNFFSSLVGDSLFISRGVRVEARGVGGLGRAEISGWASTGRCGRLAFSGLERRRHLIIGRRGRSGLLAPARPHDLRLGGQVAHDLHDFRRGAEDKLLPALGHRQAV